MHTPRSTPTVGLISMATVSSLPLRWITMTTEPGEPQESIPEAVSHSTPKQVKNKNTKKEAIFKRDSQNNVKCDITSCVHREGRVGHHRAKLRPHWARTRRVTCRRPVGSLALQPEIHWASGPCRPKWPCWMAHFSPAPWRWDRWWDRWRQVMRQVQTGETGGETGADRWTGETGEDWGGSEVWFQSISVLSSAPCPDLAHLQGTEPVETVNSKQQTTCYFTHMKTWNTEASICHVETCSWSSVVWEGLWTHQPAGERLLCFVLQRRRQQQGTCLSVDLFTCLLTCLLTCLSVCWPVSPCLVELVGSGEGDEETNQRSVAPPTSSEGRGRIGLILIG